MDTKDDRKPMPKYKPLPWLKALAWIAATGVAGAVLYGVAALLLHPAALQEGRPIWWPLSLLAALSPVVASFAHGTWRVGAAMVLLFAGACAAAVALLIAAVVANGRAGWNYT